MISKRAIQAFLNRKLKDYSKVKRLSDKRIDQELAKLPGPLPFEHWPKKPFRSQKDCFLIAAHEPCFPFLSDMGTGKSGVILATVEWRKSQNKPNKTLVLVPSPTNIDSWDIETRDWAPTLDFVPMYGSSEDRWNLLNQTDGDLFVLNYGGLVAMCTEKSAKKKGLQIAWSKVHELASHFDGIVMDELHNLKNWKSLQSKICKGIAGSMKFRYGLTGTPMNRDPQDLWMQFYIIDGGQTLGYTLGMYRAAFFNTKKNKWGGYEHTFIKRMKDDLARTLNHGSITYRLEECHDLPKTNRIIKRAPVSEAGIEYYNQIAAELKQAKGDKRLIENSFLRLRQLSSGFLGIIGDEGKIELDLPDCPKLDDLMEVVDEIDPDRKIIIFYNFTPSGQRVCDALKKQKIKHVWLYGGTKDKGATYRTFRDSDDVRVLVANVDSGGTGLNLQVANYVLFFESPVDPITREQAEKRIRPHLQTQPIFYYDFVSTGTVDERVLEFIKEGKDLSEAILSDPEQIDLLEGHDGKKSGRRKN